MRYLYLIRDAALEVATLVGVVVLIGSLGVCAAALLSPIAGGP